MFILGNSMSPYYILCITEYLQDYKIPATLTRGRLCRVVGKWDIHKAVLKCVSIRLADSNEWNSVKIMVATSDKYMRQIASSLNEI